MKFDAFHDPTSSVYREPFGALECGGTVVLRLYHRMNGAASLRVWDGEERITEPFEITEKDGGVLCSFRVPARRKGIMWYSFRIAAEEGVLYVGAEDGELRLGCSFSHELPKDFRITVYDKDFAVPEWFRGCITYQIFPDRFYHAADPKEDEAAAYHRQRGRRIDVKRWSEQVDYLPRDGAKHYSPTDFYLGNFRGITEKIPYLKSLGVGALYLNPIFESPYNHRYSIADYLKPDPLLGSEEDFAAMCAALKKEGIRVILDGVFSHTGDDSVYFDRYGSYGGGAFDNENSPYRSWYVFDKKYRCGYKSWWGFDTLPEVNELDPGYMEFIAGVLKKWMMLGASGWRLDVADELPDEFIKFLRGTVKSIDPEAVLIGEVWEDAAVKTGDTDGRGTVARRGYTDGDMLDGVMDYPFADAVCDFLNGRESAFRLRDRLVSQIAGYPADFMSAQLGLLGSHDTIRILSRLSGAPGRDDLTREKQAKWRPEAAALAEGGKRLMQAALLQFAMPFAPCIYYGDEAGMQGMADPFCRAPFPWGEEDEELLRFWRLLASARKNSPALMRGTTSFAAPDGDTFVICREYNGKKTLAAVARAPREITLKKEDFFGENDGAELKLTIEDKLLTDAE